MDAFLKGRPAGVRIAFDNWGIRMNVLHKAHIVRTTEPGALAEAKPCAIFRLIQGLDLTSK